MDAVATPPVAASPAVTRETLMANSRLTFEDKVMQDALSLTEQLTRQVMTQMTHDTDMKYHFEGA